MRIHDMRFTFKELNEDQTYELNKGIIHQRAKAVRSARQSFDYEDNEFECDGYIHLTKSNRFFVYKIKFGFTPYDDRRILSESTTEVTLDKWLDTINNARHFDKD